MYIFLINLILIKSKKLFQVMIHLTVLVQVLVTNFLHTI